MSKRFASTDPSTPSSGYAGPGALTIFRIDSGESGTLVAKFECLRNGAMLRCVSLGIRQNHSASRYGASSSEARGGPFSCHRFVPQSREPVLCRWLSARTHVLNHSFVPKEMKGLP